MHHTCKSLQVLGVGRNDILLFLQKLEVLSDTGPHVDKAHESLLDGGDLRGTYTPSIPLHGLADVWDLPIGRIPLFARRWLERGCHAGRLSLRVALGVCEGQDAPYKGGLKSKGLWWRRGQQGRTCCTTCSRQPRAYKIGARPLALTPRGLRRASTMNRTRHRACWRCLALHTGGIGRRCLARALSWTSCSNFCRRK